MLGLLLIVGGGMNMMWAAKVTYHILTLPIDSTSRYNYHMKPVVHGYRLEAVKVVVDNQTTVELPAHYKSPLAKNFKYYIPTDITIGSVQKLFDNSKNPNKGTIYQVKGETTVETGDDATPVAEGTPIPGSTAEYYVVYEYNAANTIAQLDGSVRYNIRTMYKDKSVFKDKGFFALNRGRNNRPAVLPTANVTPEMLASDDFVKASTDGTSVSPFWKDGNNKNKEADVASQFFFMFKFEGLDPYNIIIRTAYAKDSTYIEKNDGTSDFVYKRYKEGSLFTVGTANAYIASDEHILYNILYNTSTYPTNPTNLVEGAGSGYTFKSGNYHGQTNAIWNSFALLNNNNNTGYVFMGTRTVDADGVIPDAPYYLKEKDGRNNLVLSTGNSSDNLSIEGIYPIKKVNFKVPTPFYAVEASDDHIVTVEDWVSMYTVENDPIETKYLPASLKRKYCSFNNKFYKDAARTQEITHFSEAYNSSTGEYDVYLSYTVSASIPFKAITPASAYDATTWAGATWYELTDAASTQIDGMKLKYDGANYFKNDGADGDYAKTSEFAFIGDPYELRVVYRNATSGATPYYVGAVGTPDSPTNLTISTSETAGYLWEIPNDATSGSFLLQKYKGVGNWYWEVTRPAPVAVTYGVSSTYNVATANAQAVTFNVSGLTNDDSHYITVTAGGDNPEQVTAPAGKIYVEAGGTASVTVAIKARGNSDKTFTLTIQEYDAGNAKVSTASVITVNQNNASITSDAVKYSTASSTRVKVMELPKKTYTYKIVDRSGTIAVTASTSQTIFSPLSLASIPSIIVSPFILDEVITFYSSFNSGSGAGTGTSRTHLSGAITETPPADALIYVKYTTANLGSKPFLLNEDQEIFVRLNGQYLYYEDGTIKSSATSVSDDRYKWKLRNRDPYAMLVDNMEARKVLPDQENNIANASEEITVPTDDNGVTGTEPRHKGAWVKLETAVGNDVALDFTTDRTVAQRFVAKSSARTGVYEVMVATGDDVDASTNYYHIGRSGDNIKIYSNATYQAGDDDEIKFRLEENTSYYYHLIDKSKHELLTVESKSPELVLPAEYQSPLVRTYNYYAPDNITITGDTYSPTNPATKLSSLSGLDATYTKTSGDYSTDWNNSAGLVANDVTDLDALAKKLTSEGDFYFKVGESTYYCVHVSKPCYRSIYVTYENNDLIGFNNTGRINDHPYLLKFLNPLAEGYYLEDGNDGLTTEKIKAIYPYCNGDGNLNIYGELMRDEQMGGGSSTRSRWVWYFESATNDPYHVRIHSRNTISFGGINYPTYLQTYAVHFNQDNDPNTKHIVTGGTLPGVASETPTEYMILGVAGQFTLLTTHLIEGERRKVTSFEQYWKTYNMVKQHILGLPESTDAYSDDAYTWEVPTKDDPKTDGVDESTYRTTLSARGWHSYDAYASAVRWNGYNDKSSGKKTKIVEKLEHWYQTFDMGNGAFDIEDADIPPVLVLLDRHGWEIMRKPLPAAHYPEGEDELAALRAYDSPLVDRYYFYSNATKATGCHKYTLRLNDKGEERDQIKYKGEHYSSTSLGDLPGPEATGVKSNGVLNDQFVIYTVKEEYEQSYQYNFEDNGNGTYAESGTASKFLILQNARFARDNEGTGDRIDYLSKPIHEASNPPGGSMYDMIISPNTVTQSNVSTNVDENNDGIIDDKNLWYIQPNLNIDKEMGIKWATVSGGSSEPMTEYETKKAYKDKTGFDPYNNQLKNARNNKFLTAHMTFTKLENGIMVGDYSGADASASLTLEDWVNVKEANTSIQRKIDDVLVDEGYDHTNLKVTNQTFMAVSDANGNMQLMPRFDHTKRINVTLGSSSHTTLEDPVDHAKAEADKNSSMGPQTVFFVRMQRYIYHIIDNYGREALRYTRGGDDYPTITDHFKSPLAKDFTYYTGLAVFETPESPIAESNENAWNNAQKEFQREVTKDGVLNDMIKLLPTAGTYQFKVGARGSFNYYSVIVTKGLLEQQITGSLAAKHLPDTDCHIYVRYNYDEDADHDGDRILQGQWFTVKLNDKDLQADGTVVLTAGPTLGTGVKLYAGNKPLVGENNINDKPETIDADAKKWQWKFMATLADPSSDYYEAPDPYAVQVFNRHANYTTDPTTNPSPMGVGIKVPDATSGADRFALLSHPTGGYALAVAKTYGAASIEFLNGADMTTSVAATTAAEAGFTYKTGAISNGAQVVLNNDVVFNYRYHVITNGNKLAITAEQNNEDASSHGFKPYLPESAQTPLLNMNDYLYYGFARNLGEGNYRVIPQTILYTLSGLYDDVVYVRYGEYNPDSTEYKVPNEKGTDGGHVAQGSHSNDVAMNIKGRLPYNIIWYNDNMMATTTAEGTTTITDGGSHRLTGSKDSVWYFTGGDPYALKIKHKESGKFVDGTTTLVDTASALNFMLLKKEGYKYGILQQTGGTNRLTGYGNELTSGDPTKFIIFGLSVHDLIYHLIIATTCVDTTVANPPAGQYVDIHYRAGTEASPSESLTTKRIYGTTQRDLTSINASGTTHYAGEKYQLGTTLEWGGTSHTYSHDAGVVSIGDVLQVPNVFHRPNCTYAYYIEGIYNTAGTTSESTLDDKYKGLNLKYLMSDPDLIDKTVVVNIVYKFNDTLATNSGLDFVRSKDQNLWYTFETQKGATPYLAHYTNAWGLQAMAGRDTRYTNDYLWTPLGDVYGFKMYNRYMLKNSGGTENVMTMNDIAEGTNLYLAVPGTTLRPEAEYGENSPIPTDYAIFELMPGNANGYFRVHPVANTKEQTQYYVKRNASDYAVLSNVTNDSTDWTFGLDMTLIEPYYERAGYVGGLTPEGKTAYDEAVATGKITEIQKVVYNGANIIPYTPGYYRLHNQPGVSGISPVRYASGYLHDTEKTAGYGSAGIPMHFYSRKGVRGTFNGETNPLGSGYTVTNATQGEIPVDPTEYDPSTIFYFDGTTTMDGNPRSTIQTQGLYVAANANGDGDGGTGNNKQQRAVMKALAPEEVAGQAITFSLMDIGGAVLLIHDGAAPQTRRYLNFDQSKADSIYDLRYYHNSPTDDAKWCMQPVQKTATAGNGEMPLVITTNNGGDGYYYATFYAPFDVLLPNDVEAKTYNAYICKKWYDTGVNPSPVPARTVNEVSYAEGKFVPAATPVIIRVKDESGTVMLTLPTSSPSPALSSCVFQGSYLEGLLANDAGHTVYTLGVPFISEVTEDETPTIPGDISAPRPEFDNTGVGFYINATPNKEANALEANWKRNNRYVLHNKIYYYRANGASPAPERTGDTAFVPVLFGDDDEQPTQSDDNQQPTVGDGNVYDLLGRKVATEAEVRDGTWHLRLTPGIYIVGGKKVCVGIY